MVMTSTRSLALTVATCAIYSCNTQSDVDALKLTVRTRPSVQGITRALSFSRRCRITPTTTVDVDVDEETNRTTTSDSVSSPDDLEESPAVTKVFFDVDRYLNEQILPSATKDQDGSDTKTTFLEQAELDLFDPAIQLWNLGKKQKKKLDLFDIHIVMAELDQDLFEKVMETKKLFGKVMLYYVKVFKVKLEEYIKNVVKNKDSSLGHQDLLLVDLKYTQYVTVGAKLLNVAEEVSSLSKMELFGENGVQVKKRLYCIIDEGIDEKYYAVGDVELTRVAHQLVFQMIKKITPKKVSLDSLISIYTTATSSMH